MISQLQLQLLGIARRWAEKNIPDFDDTQYRMVLRNIGQVHADNPSSKQLDNRSFEQVMAWFESAGFKFTARGESDPADSSPYWNRKSARQSNNEISDREIRLIEQLAADYDPDAAETLIAGMCRRLTHHRTDDVRQLRRREAFNLIEAFKAMIERAAAEERMERHHQQQKSTKPHRSNTKHVPELSESERLEIAEAANVPF